MSSNNPKNRAQPYRQHWVNKYERFETRYQLISIICLVQANHASQAGRCHYSAIHDVKRHDRHHRFGDMYIVSVPSESWDTDGQNFQAMSSSLVSALHCDLEAAMATISMNQCWWMLLRMEDAAAWWVSILLCVWIDVASNYSQALFIGSTTIAEYQGYSLTKVSSPEIVEHDRDRWSIAKPPKVRFDKP